MEQRILDFYEAMIKTKGLTDELCIWNSMRDIVFNHYKNGDLLKELEKFGNSDITTGVNIRDYIGLDKEKIDNHMERHESKLKQLTKINLNTLCVPDVYHIIGKKQSNETIIPVTAYRIAYNMSHVISILATFSNKRKIVVEIGGGYGLSAYILSNNVNNICHIIVDIPSTGILSAYFLIKQGKKVLLYNEINDQRLNDQQISTYDVIIVPPCMIETFGVNFADVVINTASLTEMDPKYIRYYVEHISRIAKYYYSDNHLLLNSKTVESCYKEYLTDFECTLDQSTPIIYTTGLWDDISFVERIYKKGDSRPP
jgi:hypothetical protein